jgi:hypothetical protein
MQTTLAFRNYGERVGSPQAQRAHAAFTAKRYSLPVESMPERLCKLKCTDKDYVLCCWLGWLGEFSFIVTKVHQPVEARRYSASSTTIFFSAAKLAVFFFCCFNFQSDTAALMASSASMLQCNLTGGSFKWAAMSEFLIDITSSTVLPLTHSVTTELLAMALPQPNVLNFDSMMRPVSSSTLICNRITSPQAGAPTSPCRTPSMPSMKIYSTDSNNNNKYNKSTV